MRQALETYAKEIGVNLVCICGHIGGLHWHTGPSSATEFSDCDVCPCESFRKAERE